MSSIAERLLLAESLARDAGKLILQAGIERNFVIDTKSSVTDLVTQVDHAAEALIVDGISTAFPDDSIIGEEGAFRNPGAEFSWLIDPIDGTSNFVRGIPHFAVSIGIERSGSPVAGCIYDPTHDELFAASEGGASTRNAVPIKTSDRKPGDALIVALEGILRAETHEHRHSAERLITREAVIIRHSGSSALALSWVADGRLDGFFWFGIGAWDYSAGLALVKGAGGVVHAIGNDMAAAGVAAANEEVAQLLAEIINEQS